MLGQFRKYNFQIREFSRTFYYYILWLFPNTTIFPSSDLATTMDYKAMAVNRVSFTRELVIEHVYKTYQNNKFNSDVEIVEFIWPKKKSTSTKAIWLTIVWILGIVERTL